MGSPEETRGNVPMYSTMFEFLQKHPGDYQSRELAARLGIPVKEGNKQLREIMKTYPDSVSRIGDGLYRVRFGKDVSDSTDATEELGFAHGVTVILEIYDIKGDKNGEAYLAVVVNGYDANLWEKTHQGEELRPGDRVEGIILTTPRYSNNFSTMLVKISKTVYQLSVRGQLSDY
jgi:hypothetical protein